MKATIKAFTGLGAIFVSLVGVGLLAGTVYAYLKSDIFLGDTNNRNLILGILFGASIAVIGTGINGLCGICKQKPKMMCAFQILIIFFLLIFLGIAIGIYYLPDTVFNGDCQTNTNPMVSVANQIYTNAKSFCQNPVCLCAMDITTQTLLNKGYSANQITYIQTFQTGGTAINAESCLQLDPIQTQLITTLGTLEDFLNCSNWCQDTTLNSNLIFRLSNVNNGRPQYFCYTRLINVFGDYSHILQIIAFSTSGFFGLLFICNIYLCCCVSKKRRKNNGRRGLTDRLMYQMPRNDDSDDD